MSLASINLDYPWKLDRLKYWYRERDQITTNMKHDFRFRGLTKKINFDY